jgi:hypothetical protein
LDKNLADESIMKTLYNNDVVKILFKRPDLLPKIGWKLKRGDKVSTDLYNIVNLITKRPEFINYYADELSKAHPYNIAYIIDRHPNFINYFKNRLSEFGNNEIPLILSNHPELITYFKNDLNKLEPLKVEILLSLQPQLINYFKNRLQYFGGNNIGEVLSKQPKLYPYFKDYLHKLNDEERNHILWSASLAKEKGWKSTKEYEPLVNLLKNRSDSIKK